MSMYATNTVHNSFYLVLQLRKPEHMISLPQSVCAGDQVTHHTPTLIRDQTRWFVSPPGCVVDFAKAVWGPLPATPLYTRAPVHPRKPT